GLVLLAVVAGAFFLGRGRRTWAAVGVTLVACVLAVTPWVVRNRISVGCLTLTTDTRALWKANNVNTYRTLAEGKWIDDVPTLPNEPPTPAFASAYYKAYGKVLHVNECQRMRYYRHLVFEFWGDHPGEKAKLAGQATRMLWDPRSIRTEGRSSSGGFVDRARTWAQPVYMIPVYLLAAVGLFVLPRRLAWLTVAMLAYQTVVAMGFAGAPRDRVAWGFALAPAASAAGGGAGQGRG